jgi:nitrogen permease regulator 2
MGHRRPRPVSGINPDLLESRRISMGEVPQLRRQASGTLTPVATSAPHHLSKILSGNGPDTRRGGSQFRPTQYRTSPSPDTGSYTHQSHINAVSLASYPPELPGYLDGTHHTDELATRFEVGWPVLEKWLVALGEGQGNGDFGRVAIMYR